MTRHKVRHGKGKFYLFFVLTGLFLGIYPVLQTHVSAHVATWSGMRLIGNHFGYTLAALIFAYLNRNRKGWKGNFGISVLLLAIANATYYLLIELLDLIGFLPYGTPPLYQQIMSFAMWLVISAVLSMLIAIAVRFIKEGKTRKLRVVAQIVTYLGLLWVLYAFYVQFIIRTYFNHINHEDLPYRYLQEGFSGRVFSGDVFWSVVGALGCTVLFVLVWKRDKASGGFAEPLCPDKTRTLT